MPADGGNNVIATGYLTQKGFEEKMATYEEILTPLPPDAPLQDIEKRRALLVEQANRITERELDLTNKETEFLRKQREEGADDVFRPARDKNLHKIWIFAQNGRRTMLTRSGENTTTCVTQ